MSRDSVSTNRLNLLIGRTVTVDGAHYEKVEGKEHGSSLVPGDLYFGGRNTERILTVRAIEGKVVYPVGNAYAYNADECVGVKQV